MTRDDEPLPSDEHAELLAEIADQFSQNLREGNPLDLDALVEQNPEVGDQIADLLETAAMLERMREQQSLAAGGPATGHRIPDQLGDFEIIREIGRGGMGIVFEAIQQPLGRRVAVKVLPKAALWDARSIQRFRREASTAARLHHSHIVPVFGIGEHDGCHFYAMQFIEGETLSSLIESIRGDGNAGRALLPADPDTNLQRDGQEGSSYKNFATAAYYSWIAIMVGNAAEALDYAHAQGTLHRDIKPSNLLLDIHGHLWIADFGLALPSDDCLRRDTKTVAGTLHYMAPEQLDGWPEQRSDVYSLGLVLFELLSLQPAFGQRSGHRAVSPEVPRPRSIEPTIPRDLETIVLKATALELSDRYANAGDFAQDLKLFVAGRPIRSQRTSPVRRLSMWSRRNPVIAAVSGVATALLFALATTLIVSNVRVRNANALSEASARSEMTHRQRADLAADVALESLERILAHTIPEGELLQTIGGNSSTGGNARLPLSNDTAELLQELLETFQKLATQDQRGQTRQRIVTAKIHAGTILGLLGRLQESEDAFDSALELATSIPVDAERSDSNALHIQNIQRAKIWNAKGRLARTRRDFPAARDAHARAIEILAGVLQDKSVRSSPGHERITKLELAASHYWMAQRMDVPPSANRRRRVVRLSGDRDETIRTLDRALDQLASISELTDDARLLSALCQVEKSAVLRRSSPDQSQTLYSSAVATLEQLAERHPFNARIRSALALGLSTGVARDRQLDDERVRDFEDRVSESIRHAQHLVDQQPNAPRFQYLLQQLRHKHGTLLSRLGRHDESEQRYRIARDELVSLESSHPNFPVFALRRAFVEQSLARLLIESDQGDSKKRAEASQLLSSSQQTIRDLYHESADSNLLSRLDEIDRLLARLSSRQL